MYSDDKEILKEGETQSVKEQTDVSSVDVGVQEGLSDSEIKLAQLERDYKQLQRAFTKTRQQMKGREEDMQFIDYIKAKSDLMEQVNELVLSYKGSVSEVYAKPKEQNVGDITEALTFLLQQPDYKTYNDEILAFADAEGIDTDNPVELKKAYFLWRGANVEKLVKDSLKREQDSVDKKKVVRESAPKLQDSGSSYTPPPDYKNMSEMDILKSLNVPFMKDSK